MTRLETNSQITDAGVEIESCWFNGQGNGASVVSFASLQCLCISSCFWYFYFPKTLMCYFSTGCNRVPGVLVFCSRWSHWKALPLCLEGNMQTLGTLRHMPAVIVSYCLWNATFWHDLKDTSSVWILTFHWSFTGPRVEARRNGW